MEQSNEVTNGRYTLYLLISLTFVLVIVDLLEVYQIISIWNKSLKLNKEIFNECLKWELIYRSVTSFFSLCSALGALIAIVLLTSFYSNIRFSYEFFSVLKYYLIKIFGFLLLSMCILAYYNFFSVFYVCDKNKLDNFSKIQQTKLFALGNFFSVFILFLLSLAIVLINFKYEMGQFFIKSYKHKEGGSNLYINIFFSFLSKKVDTKELAITGLKILQERQLNEQNDMEAIQLEAQQQLGNIMNA